MDGEKLSIEGINKLIDNNSINKINYPSSKTILDALESSNIQQASAAIEIVRRSVNNNIQIESSTEITKSLINLLDHGNPDIRQKAAFTIGVWGQSEVKQKEIIADLVSTVKNDNNTKVRRNAINSILKIVSKNPELVEDLEIDVITDCLRDENKWILIEAVRLLSQIAKNDLDFASRLIPRLQNVIQNEGISAEEISVKSLSEIAQQHPTLSSDIIPILIKKSSGTEPYKQIAIIVETHPSVADQLLEYEEHFKNVEDIDSDLPKSENPIEDILNMMPEGKDAQAATDDTPTPVRDKNKEDLATPKASLPTGDTLGDDFIYEDVEQIDILGRGAADVYEARIDGDDSEHVVLKEPRFAGELDTDTRENFLEEAQYWAEMSDHPHVVDIINWGESPHPWLVAEYLEGGDLSNRTTELNEALWICARIADALHEAHTLGLRHFDLKPENVLLRRVEDNPWDVPKVSDWGLARFQLEHSGRLSSFTPQYGAPEQFLPEKFDGLDNQTDLYQLGLVLYELTTGEHPFPDRSGAVATEQLHKSPTPPTELDESLPARLDEITERLLAPQPTDRYDSAAVVRNVMDRLRTGEAVGQKALADRADLYASALEYARGESLRECQRWAKEIQKFVVNNPVEDAAYGDTRKDVASFVDKWFAERELVYGSDHALMTGGDIDLANEHPELYHDIADLAEVVRRLYLRAV